MDKQLNDEPLLEAPDKELMLDETNVDTDQNIDSRQPSAPTTVDAATATPEPAQPQSYNHFETSPPLKKKGKAGTVILVIILIILALLAVAYGAYEMQRNANLQKASSDKTTAINGLTQQISTLKSNKTKTVASVTTSSSIIALKELGVSITLPSSIKDLTYAYQPSVSGGTVLPTLNLSTDTISDSDTLSSSSDATRCSVTSTTPALGRLEKISGTYSLAKYPVGPTLAKQFSTYFIGYEHEQAACSDSTSLNASIDTDTSALQNSFPTITAL